MWYVNTQTGVNHECEKEYFDRFYKDNPDIQEIPDVDQKEADDIEAKKKTRKDLIAEAKAEGIKGADRMTVEELKKAVE